MVCSSPEVAFTYARGKEQAQDLAAPVAAAGGRAVPILADSADADAVRAAVTQTVDVLGGLDILVNNAGVAHVAPIEDFPRGVRPDAAVNVRGVFTAVQAAVPHLRSGGRIITISSINADRAPVPGIGAYALTKAAVAELSRGLARELGPRGITVNTIQPGPTETDMNPGAGPFADAMRALLPVGHYAQPADTASVVAYLASHESRFVTGVSWDVDGGFAV